MTNREVLIDALSREEYEVDVTIASYIACPYINNPDCKYDGGNNTSVCDYCKAEWLNKEWEG